MVYIPISEASFFKVEAGEQKLYKRMDYRGALQKGNLFRFIERSGYLLSTSIRATILQNPSNQLQFILIRWAVTINRDKWREDWTTQIINSIEGDETRLIQQIKDNNTKVMIVSDGLYYLEL